MLPSDRPKTIVSMLRQLSKEDGKTLIEMMEADRPAAFPERTEDPQPAAPSAPSAQEPVLTIDADGKIRVRPPPGCSEQMVAFLHSDTIGGAVYSSQLAGVSSEPLILDTAICHVSDVVQRINPTDPLEEMLAMQAQWTHARIAKLTFLAAQQTSIESITMLNEALDRATNIFRRIILALAEYRRPARAGVFMPVAQLNTAGQQVVQNVVGELPAPQKLTNEQGLIDDEHKARPALSAHPGGNGFPAFCR